MVSRILTRPRTPAGVQLQGSIKKPRVTLVANKNHHLFHNTVLSIPFTEGIGDAYDAKDRSITATNGGSNWVTGALGGLGCTPDTGGFNIARNLGSHQQTTHICIYENPNDNSQTNWRYFSDGRDGSGTWFYLGGSGEEGVQFGGVRLNNDPIVKDRGYICAAAIATQTGTRVIARNYTKGDQDAVDGIFTAPSVGANFKLLQSRTNSSRFGGIALYYFIFNIALTDEKIFDIGRNPGQLFKDANDRTFVYPVAAPPTPEIEIPLFFGTNF